MLVALELYSPAYPLAFARLPTFSTRSPSPCRYARAPVPDPSPPLRAHLASPPCSRSHPARAIPALLARPSPHDSPVLVPLRPHPTIPRSCAAPRRRISARVARTASCALRILLSPPPSPLPPSPSAGDGLPPSPHIPPTPYQPPPLACPPANLLHLCPLCWPTHRPRPPPHPPASPCRLATLSARAHASRDGLRVRAAAAVSPLRPSSLAIGTAGGSVIAAATPRHTAASSTAAAAQNPPLSPNRRGANSSGDCRPAGSSRNRPARVVWWGVSYPF